MHLGDFLEFLLLMRHIFVVAGVFSLFYLSRIASPAAFAVVLVANWVFVAFVFIVLVLFFLELSNMRKAHWGYAIQQCFCIVFRVEMHWI